MQELLSDLRLEINQDDSDFGRSDLPLFLDRWRTLWGLVFQRVRVLSQLHAGQFALFRAVLPDG